MHTHVLDNGKCGVLNKRSATRFVTPVLNPSHNCFRFSCFHAVDDKWKMLAKNIVLLSSTFKMILFSFSLSRSLSLSHLFVGLWSLVFIIFFIRFHFVATISAFKTKSVATDNAYMLINENETTNKSEFSGVYVCMYRAGSKKPSTTNGKNAVTLTI